MESILKKTSLALALNAAIEDMKLEADRSFFMGLLMEAFDTKINEFRRIHSSNFPSINVKGSYIIDNEFPIGEGDMQQYFRCLAFQLKIGSVSIINSHDKLKRPFNLVEAYSKNESRKRAVSKSSGSSVKSLEKQLIRKKKCK